MTWNRPLAIILMLIFSTFQVNAALGQEKSNHTQLADITSANTDVQTDSQHLAAYHQYWQHHSFFQHLSNSANQPGLWELMQFEYTLAVTTLTNLYSNWRAHISSAQDQASNDVFGHYHPLVRTVLTLVFATLTFSLLQRLAKRSTTLLLHFNNLISNKAAKQAWAKALARLLASSALLAPWILLWLALSVYTASFAQHSALLLYWWVPLAKLYIIYGLLRLVAEWLLLRISSSAGVFLGSDKNKLLRIHAHRHAAWLVWPWVLIYAIHHWIGVSLLYRLTEVFAWLVAWLVLANLLKLRQHDYLANIKQLLPEKLDPLLDQLTSEKLFLLIGTLLLPLQILQFLLQYIDQVLTDFDWYRRLNARWFRMRTKVLADQDAPTNLDEDVPLQYERWFIPEGSAEHEFPVIPTGLLEAIRKPVDAWLNERTDENALVVTGEKGIGKTAALSRLKSSISKDYPQVQVLRLSVPAKTTNPDDLYKLIGDLLNTDLSQGPAMLARTDAERPPTLLILDEAQNLFLADVEHLDGWRALLNLTNVRVENLFWIVSINNQSWAYLCNVFGREYQIRNAIYAKRWSQDEIRSLILSRNHLGGYKLRYDDVLLSSRGSDAGNLRNAEQRYFSLLWDSCRGIPMTALGMWLTSVRTQGRVVTVGLPQVPDSSVLETLGAKLMFVYAAIVTHENLTFDELLRVTNQQENVVRYALKSALNAEFIERSSDGRYRITSLWYHTVISYLARKNMLNE